MQYKTIVYELLQYYPDQLRSRSGNEPLISILNLWAEKLRELHLQRLSELQKQYPLESILVLMNSSLECAIQQIQEALEALSTDTPSDFSLDEVMQHIKRNSPPN